MNTSTLLLPPYVVGGSSVVGRVVVVKMLIFTDLLFFTKEFMNPTFTASPKMICKILPKYLRDELIAASAISDKRLCQQTIREIEGRARLQHRQLFNFD